MNSYYVSERPTETRFKNNKMLCKYVLNITVDMNILSNIFKKRRFFIAEKNMKTHKIASKIKIFFFVFSCYSTV